MGQAPLLFRGKRKADTNGIGFAKPACAVEFV